VNQGQGVSGIEGVHVVGDDIVVGYRSRDDHHVDVALAAGDTTLERLGEIDAGYADDILVAGSTFYAPDASGLHSGSLTGGDAQALSWAREVIDERLAGAYRATLARDAGGQGVLELSRDGKQIASFDAGPDPARLIADDERVLVLSLEPNGQCATGPACRDYAPNAAIVTLGDTPQLGAIAPLTDPDALGVAANGENRINWDIEGDVAFALGNGHFVLIADYEATCSSKDECAALGVSAQPGNTMQNSPAAGATPPCAPGASCPPAPAPSPAPVESGVSGEKHATRLYLLDATATTPHFAAPVDSTLELQDSRFAPPRVSGGTLMITRIERPYVAGTASGSQPAHFMLDRFTVTGSSLLAKPPVNVPGFPIALDDGGARLFSAEPDAATPGAGTLYMLALGDDDTARTLDHVGLAASYSDAVGAFGKIFYLSHDGTDCSGKSTLAPFAVPTKNTGKLAALPVFELPGGRYHIADARDGRLLLTDDGGHYVILDVSGDTPKLVKFVSAPAGPTPPKLQGDSVIGASGLYPDELSF
jgi:hypothetical protein